MENLTFAEEAMLKSWHEYVRSYSPNIRSYDPKMHTIHRKLLYYLMSEDLIEYFKQENVPTYSATALERMGISPSTLKSGRDQWGEIMEKNEALVPFFDFRKILRKICSTFAADFDKKENRKENERRKRNIKPTANREIPRRTY